MRGDGLQQLTRYRDIIGVMGELLQVRVPQSAGVEPVVRHGDLAIIEPDERTKKRLLGEVISVDGERVSLQVFGGTSGITSAARVAFLGHPMRATFSDNILGRAFAGSGTAIDGGPSLDMDPSIEIGGPTVNPFERTVPSRMIRTNVPMIDVFNCLVESQKIPIFSVAGEPYNALLARIGAQADADIIVFGGIGLMFDDVHMFQSSFEKAGIQPQTVMFINQALDPVAERLLVPDIALAVAERFAVDHGKRVLVLLTDMTAYADAMKEVGIAMDKVPSFRGYMGDLYSQLAKRYEKACDFAQAGSVTILSVTTMPGDDVTHPVPDNTGYITEGQFYMHDGVIDPFGSLSRLKQNVIGKITREDHGQVMNTMVRLYADACAAEQRAAMAFELSDYDEKCLKFGKLFRSRFMDVTVSLPLEEALDLGWQTMAECFDASELLMKDALVKKYFPHTTPVEEELLHGAIPAE